MENQSQSETLKKYFYCTNSKVNDSTMYAIKSKINQNNPSLAFRHITKNKNKQT